MSINWTAVATRLPGVIRGAVQIAKHFKTSGADKKAAVIASIPEAEALIEAGANRDIFNEPAIAQLVDALLEAEVAVLKAQEALKAGLLAYSAPK